MSKNPFKAPRPDALIQETLEEKIQQWGKVKFKPNLSRTLNKSQAGRKEKPYDKSVSTSAAKFNVVAKNARPENATPWREFKNEMTLKDEKQRSTLINVESEETNKILKQRELNYKKSIMMEKMKEPTIWEDFQDDENEDRDKNTKRSKIVTKNVKFKNKKYSKDIISPEMLQNFNSKTLTAQQNNKLRRLITKATMNFKGTTLRQVVNNLKNRKENSEGK